jgi:type VI secretion system protein ImpM
MPAALPFEAHAGLFGKLPARGDFVRMDLPRDFTDAWDDWWQRSLLATQNRPPDEWQAAWLEAPVWRFVLPPGLCGRNGVLGLWLPSVDKAGRYSPLTIAAVAAIDWAPYVGAMTSFLQAAELAALDALECDLAPDALLQRLQENFFTDEAPTAVPDFVPSRVTLWTDGGPRVAPRRETILTLPEGRRFAALIADDWSGHK